MSSKNTHERIVFIQLGEHFKCIFRLVMRKRQESVDEQDSDLLPRGSFVVTDLIKKFAQRIVISRKRVIDSVASHVALDEVCIVFTDVSGKILAMLVYG